MGYEIYYTSAPEGLKRGTSGFCTVAATENIPKALWDRLETLSAYRHVGAEAGVQPVSFGHWILTVTGRTYHVLSRVGDAGMDHTQRTNAFAHHMVLEQQEMERAAAGPAWLLAQAGVMAGGWDGRVGNLPPRFLPASGGDSGDGVRICRRWQEITGDAGWGGQLADVFAKSPAKPVCILFGSEGGMADGGAMLEMLGEAIALLPPAARWNVTFNTYFTSMPTSATCAWRCCLAGTPAAELGKRYAAGGLILDLTDRSRLPVLSAGALVDAARTGQLPEAPRPAKAVARRGTLESPVLPHAAERISAPHAPAPESHAFDGAGADSGGVLDFAHDPGSALPPPERMADPFASAGIPAGKFRRGRARDPIASFGGTQWALEAAERAAEQSARRRRQQVLGLFFGALGAIAIGTGFVYLALRRMAPPPSLPAEPVKIAPTAAGTPVNQANAGNLTELPPTVPDFMNPPGTRPEIITPDEPMHSQSAPAPSAPPVVHYPADVTLLSALERPKVGTGIGPRTQAIGLNAKDIRAAEKVTAMKLEFPRANSGDDADSTSADGSEFRDNESGTLSAQPQPRDGLPGVVVSWKAPGKTPGGSADGDEVVFIGFDKSGPALQFDWRTAMLLKNAGMMGYYYWMLQNSVIELNNGSPNGSAQVAAQRVHFTPFAPPPLHFADVSMDMAWPADLPQGVVAAPPENAKAADAGANKSAAGGLPDGWTASWFTDWDQKDAALRSENNALQEIKFKKTTSSGAVDAWFLVTFHPGFTKIDSTFARRRAQDKADLEKFRNELAALDDQIAQAKSVGRGVTTQPVSPELQTKYDQTQALVASYTEVMQAYDALKEFDVSIELPGRVRLATLHFERADDKAGN